MSRPFVLLGALALALAACSETTPSTTVAVLPGEPPAVELVPEAGDTPATETPAPPQAGAEGRIEVTVDNTIDAEEWNGAGAYAGDGEVIEAIHYGFGASDLYLRVDFVQEILGNDQIGLDIYVDTPRRETTRTSSLQGTPLGFPATALVAWRGSDPVVADYAATLPTEPNDSMELTESLLTGFDGQSIELALPASIASNLDPSEVLVFRVVPRSLTEDIGLLPAAGPAAIRVPETGV
jgi:hypothetical protein